MTFSARIIAGFGWTAGGRFLGQLIAWAVSIVVVRILTPQDYGLLAMATVVTGFAALFSELGLGWAVVHTPTVDVPTLRRVFGLVIVVNGVLTALAFAVAPLVALFFGEDRLIPIIRVASLQFLIAAPGVIPDAILQRELEFKRRSIVELSATMVGGASTLGLALAGLGVWAMVYGSLLAIAWRTIGINLVRPFLHLPAIGFRGLRKLFAFGGYVAVARVLQYLYIQSDLIIGGRFLGKEQIGYYSVGMHLASLPMQRISGILNEVAFPAFARIQQDRARVGSYLLRSISLLCVFGFSVFWGIAAVAPEIVNVLLGEKWEPAILPLQLLALVMPIRMLGQLMPPTLQGVGEARLAASNQLVACIVLTAAFLAGAQFGIVGLSAAWLIAFPVVLLVNLRTWLPVLGLRARQFIGATARPAIAGAGMFAGVAAVRAGQLANGLVELLLLIAVGAVTYVALSMAINRDALSDVRSLFLTGVRSRKE